MSMPACPETELSFCVQEILSSGPEDGIMMLTIPDHTGVLDFSDVESIPAWFIAALAQMILKQPTDQPQLSFVSVEEPVRNTLAACGLSHHLQ